MALPQSDAPSGMTLDEWAEACWPLLAIRPKTLHGYRLAYAKHIQPVFGGMDIDSITKRRVQAWVLGQSPTLGKANLPILKSLYREAVTYEMAASNPTVGVKRRPHISPRRNFVTWDVLQSMEFGRYTSLIYFLAAHGLRWSEARALEPADIHDGYVYVTKSAEGLPTKSGRERRVPYLGFFSADWPRSYKWCRLTLHDRAGVTIHSLRKTYAHSLKTAGVHPQVAQKLLGHASITMTLDLYTDVLPDELNDAGTLLRQQLRITKGSGECAG